MSLRFALFAPPLALALTACSYSTQYRLLDRHTVTDPTQSRITNFLSSPMRPGQPAEQTPRGVPRESVIDEAQITEYVAGRVCVAVVMRTDVAIDVPLSQLNAKINGREVAFDAERVIVRDVDNHGGASSPATASTDAAHFDAASLPAKADDTCRVIERRASACGPRGKGSPETVRLELDFPADNLSTPWGEVFEWRVKDE